MVFLHARKVGQRELRYGYACLKKDRKKAEKFDEDRDRDIESVPRVTSDQYRRDATLYSKATTSKRVTTILRHSVQLSRWPRRI